MAEIKPTKVRVLNIKLPRNLGAERGRKLTDPIALSEGASVRLLPGEISNVEKASFQCHQAGPLKDKRFIMFVVPAGLSLAKMNRLLKTGVEKMQPLVASFRGDEIRALMDKGTNAPGFDAEMQRILGGSETLASIQKKAVTAGRGPKKGRRKDTDGRKRRAEKLYRLAAGINGGSYYATHAERCRNVQKQMTREKFVISAKRLQAILRPLFHRLQKKRRQ